MRTTIELKDEQRARLLELAARRGEKGFSSVIAEAIEAHLQRIDASENARAQAKRARGSLSRKDADQLRRTATELRESMAMIVADTDVLIDYLGGHDPGADRVALELERGDLATTVVNRFELLSGVRNERQERAVRQLLGALTTLPLDTQASDEAAAIRRALERNGTPIGMGDSLIAGIVRARRGVLLTRNRRHFDRVEGLKLSVLATRP